MSADRFMNAMRRQAAQQDASSGQPRWGTVANVDSANQLARVLLQPDGVLTGWLPIASAGAGPGWGVVSIPTAGQQAFVIPDGGDAQHGVIVGFGHSTASAPPKVPSAAAGDGNSPSNGQPGETLLVHASGACIRLCADGTIYIRAPQVNIDGDLHVSGDVFDRKDAHGTLQTLRAAHNQHHHTNVGTGGGTSAIPDVLTP